MEYLVLARRYRPQSFKAIAAQEEIVATLKNAIQMKRTAHAYLFCGSRGTGKTTLARLFAKALNCKNRSKDAEPCNACSSCLEIAGSHAIDVLEIDGASHRGIEDIRQINETIGFSPLGGQYKIYLIDEVHMLTKEAFNALLKTLEEPPPHVKFFFCTTEPHKIPATILSRCQRFNLRRIPLDATLNTLARIAEDADIKIERGALEMIAERAEGSLRDALSLLDQISAFEKSDITVQTVAEILGLPSKEMLFALDDAGMKHDFTAPFRIAGEIYASGKNISYFLEELIAHFRTLLLIKHSALHSTRDQEKYLAAASLYRPEQLIQILEFITETQQSIKSAPSEKTALEMLMLRIIRTHTQISLESLVQRLISLEQQLNTSVDLQPKQEELPVQPAAASKPKPMEQVDSKQALSATSYLLQKPSISEDPEPKQEELPVRSTAKAPLTQNKEPKRSKPEEAKQAISAAPQQQKSFSIQSQSRFDTTMRFAAKELNGSLKKE